jgi:hypothetical protein
MAFIVSDVQFGNFSLKNGLCRLFSKRDFSVQGKEGYVHKKS